MGDKIIVTEDEPKATKPDVVVVVPVAAEKKERVVTEKTTIIKTKVE